MYMYLWGGRVGKHQKATPGNKGQGGVRIRVDLDPFFPLFCEQIFVVWSTRMSNVEARRFFHFWLRGARITVHCSDGVIAGHELGIDRHLVLP